MTTDNVGVLDARLAGGLTGGEKLALLLKKEAGSVVKWSLARGINPSEIWHTLSGLRENPEHRQAIADSLGLTRQQVDEAIGPKKEAEKVPA
jgi:hypothetical protein